MGTVILDGNSLKIKDVVNVARNNYDVKLSGEAVSKIQKARKYVDDLVDNGKIVYGITTGFGKFSDVTITKEETKELQRNLIISHACGVGDLLSEDIVRAIMLLRANNLAKGYSGIRMETLEGLIAMINKGVTPAIPEKGSLGASGDLAPLAHMVLPLIGEGEAFYNGKLINGCDAMKEAGITPVVLSAKEGLALINGTQVMTAIGLLTAYDGVNMAKLSDITASLTAEGLNGITDAYMEELHSIRPHKGQMDTAANMLSILEGSERTTKQGEIRVQDAYSLRCVPQIHGASKDALNYVLSKIEIEINSVTDNPIILVDKDMAISGGNFHGQPMALSFDFLGIALAEIANVCERRIERLVNPNLSGLPAFLTEKGGINSGFMIAQYAAAALVSENKVLAHPASVDSIPSSANQEDHVSMGTIGAVKAKEIAKNVRYTLAIECMAAAQAIDLAKENKKLGKGTEKAYNEIRKVVSKVDKDIVMYTEFEKLAEIIASNKIVDAVEEAVGELRLV